MIIKTVKGAKLDTAKPAKSSICTVLNARGNKVLDVLRITGNLETVEEFGEKVSMVEVETSFGVTQVNEEFLFQ